MNISVGELKERLTSGDALSIIDVREELEYHTFNIGGINIPLGRLPADLDGILADKDEEIVVICQRGIRSLTGQKLLQASGYSNVRNLEGGLVAFRRLNS